jgi:hypothetical protein
MTEYRFKQSESGLWVPRKDTAIDRRQFVRTTGGIIATAGLGAACGGGGDGPVDNGPVETGFLQAIITGLDPSATSGGTVTGSLTDGSEPPVTVPLPASGTSPQVEVPVGTYTLDYAPPANHAIAPGQINPQIVTVDKDEVQQVTWAVVVAESTVRVQVTGLQAGATSGGSASILRTDIPDQSPVNVQVPIAGTVDTGVTVGTYQVTYTPPSGYTVDQGVTNPQTVTAVANQIQTATFAVSQVPPGGVGDIYNHGFEDGTGGDFTNSNQTGFPLAWQFDSTTAARGTKSVRQDYPIQGAGVNVGTPFYYVMPSARTAFYCRFAYMQNSGFNNNNQDEVKVHRALGPGFNFQAGTLIILPGGQFAWKWDQLDNTAPFVGNLGPNDNQPAPNANSLDGSWHWIEIFRDISTDNALHVEIWIDDVRYFNYTTARPNQSRTYQVVQFDGTINSVTATAQAWFDEIGIGTQKMGIP